MDEKQEILDLRQELEQANYEYYVLDDPSMSDYDFDHKLRRLEELEAKYPELVTPDSPTQRVGGKVADGFTEVHHRVPLESLQDVFSFEELGDFDQRVRDALAGGVEYDVEPKVDGLSVALEYENGLFVRGATRGDGQPHSPSLSPRNRVVVQPMYCTDWDRGVMGKKACSPRKAACQW